MTSVRSWAYLVLGALLAACGGSAASTQGATNQPVDDAGVGESGPSSPNGSSDSAISVIDSVTCPDCISVDDLSWGMNGGLVQFVDTNHIKPCRTYSRVRSGGANGMPAPMCELKLAGCPSAAIADIDAMIADPVVAAALQKHAVYGVDSRPVDGQVFRFGVGSDFVDVGSDCGAGASGCVAVPTEVRELADYLQQLGDVELTQEPCKSAFAK